MPATVKDLINKRISDRMKPLFAASARKAAKSAPASAKKDDGRELSISLWLRGISQGNWYGAQAEKEAHEEWTAKAMTELTGAGGGELVPPQIETQIIPLLRAASVIRKMGVTIVNLPKTNALSLPRQTGGTTGYWVGESEAPTESQITLGDLDLRLKTLMALCKIPNNLIEDSTPAADVLVKKDIATVLALAEDLGVIAGVGGKQPLGVYNNPDINSTTLTAAISYDDLMKAQQSIEMRNGAFTAWLMSPRSKTTIRVLKDGFGRYVWEAGDVTKNVPDKLLGLPLFYTTQIATNLTFGAITAASYIILGNWPEVIVAQKRNGMTIEASTEASTAFTTDQTWIKAKRRVDAGVRQTDEFQIIKGVQAAP